MSSVIERRLLVNYRVDPGVARSLLPAPLRPQVVNGWAVAGICLIRERRVANRIFYSLVEERLALCVSRFLSAVCPEQFVFRQRRRGT